MQVSGATAYNAFALLASRLKPPTVVHYLAADKRFLRSIRKLYDIKQTASTLLCYNTRKHCCQSSHQPQTVNTWPMPSAIFNLSLQTPTAISFYFERRSCHEKMAVPQTHFIPLASQFLFAIKRCVNEHRMRYTAVYLAVAWAGYLRAAEPPTLQKTGVALPGDSHIQGSTKTRTILISITNANTGNNSCMLLRGQNIVLFLTRYLTTHPKRPLIPIR